MTVSIVGGIGIESERLSPSTSASHNIILLHLCVWVKQFYQIPLKKKLCHSKSVFLVTEAGWGS